MHVTLLAADLVPPPQFIAPPDLPRLTSLENLLARGAIASSPGAYLEDAVLGEFALHRDNAPMAAITRLADGGTVDDATWLRADPVYLHVSRDNVQLMDSHVVLPTLAEAKAITATLNAHLAQDGLVIEVLDEARWYMRVAATDAPRATPLWQVAGGAVFDQLPESDGIINWRRLQNELQMLLFDHPVNIARAENGVVPINGIWLWGAGALPAISPTTRHRHITGKLALARGLTMCASAALTPVLPKSFDELVFADSQLVVLHGATRALRANQRHDWMETVKQLERDWFTPALDALDTGRVQKLSLLLPNEVASLRIDIEPKKMGLFSWMKAAPKIKALQSYLQR